MPKPKQPAQNLNQTSAPQPMATEPSKMPMILAVVFGVLFVLATLAAAYFFMQARADQAQINQLESQMMEMKDDMDSMMMKKKEMEDESIKETDNINYYLNVETGLYFEYPTAYRTRENTELEGFDEGELSSVSVYNEQDNIVLHAQATSEDYAVGVGEGCCYYFNSTLDLSDSVENLQSAVEEQLRSIYLPQKIMIGGRQAFAFYYATSYANTVLKPAIIIPIENDIYSNIFIWGPTVFEVEEAAYDEAKTDIEAFISEDGAFEQSTLSIYHSIINSIRWQ